MTSILDIQNVTKIYNDKHKIVRALDGVSLSIQPGEIFGLLGANGAGKTTLSSILATLHPVTSGDVLYNGISIYKDLLRYRRALGFCPQHQNLDPFLTVQENLIFAGKYFLLPKNLIQERVSRLLQELELERYANFNVNELSGGTRQRVLIGRALVHEPAVVILDEPTVGLDPDIRRKLWNHILRLKEQGITVILTTHYLDEAEVLSDRICVLRKGKIHTLESVKTLRERHNMARLEDIFLSLMQEDGLE
ncbi:ABC transporter ATP-binding protein [Vermiphilus pyriformis]|jgi:ABC-2 type transport system ATP-binding protein|uniref:ABC transporter domain-containing protein n=1 Tax=candidate division TM6 bacterium JCVI TM6SC1 TaxID=1306947 RepID=A0A0D2I2V2_9BACT|nr:hypothetical protein J120_00950 [candidate division TM6 bacterium JCVI TM6SC1]UNE35818.1 MAG: ABC transporter ATP-binding protein [Vermiphilus pyriformis]